MHSPVEFLSTLSAWDGVGRLDSLLSQGLDKDDILEAEVTLPVAQPFDASLLRVASIRRPYSRDSELILVDVSRLPVP